MTGPVFEKRLACIRQVVREHGTACLPRPGIHPGLCDMVPDDRKGIMSPAEAPAWDGSPAAGPAVPGPKVTPARRPDRITPGRDRPQGPDPRPGTTDGAACSGRASPDRVRLARVSRSWRKLLLMLMPVILPFRTSFLLRVSARTGLVHTKSRFNRWLAAGWNSPAPPHGTSTRPGS